MATKKEYTIIKYHRGRETEVSGTVEELTKYFSYTLECGASWQNERGCRKVNRNPKTIKSLITAINNAFDNTQRACYDRDYVYIKEN